MLLRHKERPVWRYHTGLLAPGDFFEGAAGEFRIHSFDEGEALSPPGFTVRMGKVFVKFIYLH
ncbi:hypothetical protein KL86DPRO_11689 [uncultured delta proteobacterium]|uniref:Uncharacterized protein n=1 Tax=uncultured delta proteobacterium TaxID=34034 RepID=A0A212JKI9_9DELT|nr:hypothetical protein KL86DPRO_11689 [uncultured delta proteobacterium]